MIIYYILVLPRPPALKPFIFQIKDIPAKMIFSATWNCDHTV